MCLNGDLDGMLREYTLLQADIRDKARDELKVLEERRDVLLKILDNNPVSPSDLKEKQSVTSIAKYRDPETGKTWTGKGKRPQWFDVDRAEDFLIAV